MLNPMSRMKTRLIIAKSFHGVINAPAVYPNVCDNTTIRPCYRLVNDCFTLNHVSKYMSSFLATISANLGAIHVCQPYPFTTFCLECVSVMHFRALGFIFHCFDSFIRSVIREFDYLCYNATYKSPPIELGVMRFARTRVVAATPRIPNAMRLPFRHTPIKHPFLEKNQNG